MTTSEVTEKLFAAKKKKGLSFAKLEKALGRDEVWIAALFYRRRRLRRRRRRSLPRRSGWGRTWRLR